MSIQPKKLYTEKEYLELERAAEFKSELYKGEIFAMSGATEQHVLISTNIASALNQQFKGRPCKVYNVDLRVNVQKNTLYTYPDVVVVCGEAKFLDSHKDTLLNPKVIIEVLSKSTEQYDRVKKFELYRGLDSLEEYILVSQNEFRIEQFVKHNALEWMFSEVTNSEDVVRLHSIDAVLQVSDVYEKVVFE